MNTNTKKPVKAEKAPTKEVGQKIDEYLTITPKDLKALQAKVSHDESEFRKNMAQLDCETQIFKRSLELLKDYKLRKNGLIQLDAADIKDAKETLTACIETNTELMVETVMEFFHGDAAQDRRRLSAIMAVRNAKAGKELSKEERLLAEIFGGVTCKGKCATCGKKH